MAEVYFDHNVSRHVVPFLEAVGHDVSLARDRGLTLMPDDGQLLSAMQEGRVLITHNRRDFTLLHDAWSTWPPAFGLTFPPHHGILVLDVTSHEVLAGGLNAMLDPASGQILENEAFWWHHLAGWRRRRAGTWEPNA